MNGRKNILLVTSAFYPELSPRSFRASELAKAFCSQKHKVTVITKFRDFDYSMFLAEYPVTLKMWGKSSSPALSPKVKQKVDKISRIFSRVLMLLFEYPEIKEMLRVKRMLKGENLYDLMISFAVPFPVHWGVAWSRTKTHMIAKTWVADCGDPYMFARLDTFRKPFYFKFLEINFCQKCDYISVPFKEMSNQFYPQFSSKIKTIPQGFNLDEIRIYNGEINNEKPIFIYAGSIIPGKRDLRLFMDFICSLDRDFLFLVYTNNSDWFNAYKEKLDEKLIISGYIDRLPLVFEMSKADFLINVDTELDSRTNIEAIPSKLIDYCLSGRPILSINSAILDEDLVMEFFNQDYSRQRIINKNNYDIKIVTTAFLKLV